VDLDELKCRKRKAPDSSGEVESGAGGLRQRKGRKKCRTKAYALKHHLSGAPELVHQNADRVIFFNSEDQGLVNVEVLAALFYSKEHRRFRLSNNHAAERNTQIIGRDLQNNWLPYPQRKSTCHGIPPVFTLYGALR